MSADYLIIFRIPGEPDEPNLFVELEYKEGKLSTEGKKFTIDNPEDTYLQLGYQHVIIAKPDPQGSLDLGRFDIADDEEQPISVCEMAGDDIVAMATEVVEAYEASQAAKV